MSATSTRSAGKARQPFRLTGRRVLLGFVGFFGLILVMNGAFVWLALSTFSGTTSDKAYVEGLAYNERLAAASAQRARGWQGDLRLDEGRLSLQLADAEGRAVTGLALTARVGRPATRVYDMSLALTEVAPGLYAAAVTLEEGAWQVIVEGDDATGERPFRTEERLWR